MQYQFDLRLDVDQLPDGKIHVVFDPGITCEHGRLPDDQEQRLVPQPKGHPQWRSK